MPLNARGQRLGQLSFAHPGRPFQQDRLAQPGLQEHRGGQPLVGQVPVGGEAADDVGHVGKRLTRLAARVGPGATS